MQGAAEMGFTNSEVHLRPRPPRYHLRRLHNRQCLRRLRHLRCLFHLFVSHVNKELHLLIGRSDHLKNREIPGLPVHHVGSPSFIP